MSKKISISWNKSPPKEVAGKLEFYEIDLHQNYGLLSDPDRQDHATVKTHFSYSIVKNGKFFPETQSRVRTVYGTPSEVYDYHMKNANASKEMFVRAWQVAKDRDLSSLTVFPYKPAYVNEKISEEINKLQNNFKNTYKNVDFSVGEAYIPIKTGDKTAKYVKYSEHLKLTSEQQKQVSKLIPTYENLPNKGQSIEESIDAVLESYRGISLLFPSGKIPKEFASQVSPMREGGLATMEYMTRPINAQR